MTVPITAPIFGRALIKALTSMLTAHRGPLATSQFCVTCPTSTSHAEYRAFWTALLAVGANHSAPRIILAQPSPRNPQSAESAAAAIDMRRAGWRIKWAGAGRIHHCKVWIFGAETLIIGSHNLTQAAMLTNNEASLLTRHPQSILDTLAWFEADWARATDRPTVGLA